jgi:Ni/Fe-hydrogenase 1 B-type cytochrome subunit
VPAFCGGDMGVKKLHHWTMWFFILFAVVHVYLVFYHDYVEGRGEISIMGGGWKFIEEEVFDEGQKMTPNSEKKV